MKNLIGLTLEEISKILKDLNEPAYRSKQIFKWIYSNIDSFDKMTNISKELRYKLSNNYSINRVEIIEKLVDKKDDTKKFLILLYDGNIIECVLMKYNFGYTLCVSSQVGCRMGCTFCASTIDGIERNLSSGEMVDQIMIVEKTEDIRISNIVIMGSGEPLDNYDEVIKFIKIVNNSDGLNIGQRHITLSTCGLVPEIYKLAEENLQINLSISLHASIDEIRKKMMPIAKKYSIKELMEACKLYIKKTSRRITFEYAMVKGLNDDIIYADFLANLLNGILCIVNLIPINSIKEKNYEKSNKNNITKFSNHLKSRGINTTIRRELGSNINASCGQLRRNYLKKP